MTPARYALNLLKLADININVGLLLDPVVETFSRRAGLARKAGKPWGCVVCRVLDAIVARLGFGVGHCDRAASAGEIE